MVKKVQTLAFAHRALNRSIKTYTLIEYIDTHTPKNFACMAALPLAAATVAMLRVIPVFGRDLTLGRAN